MVSTPGRSPRAPGRAARLVGGPGPALGLPGHPRRRWTGSPASAWSARTHRRPATCPTCCATRVLAVRLLRRERPSLVVSAGAGVAVPFFVAAWLLRIPTVFIEVYDRVDTPTMTGRLCGPFTTRRIVQWQSQLEFYPDAQPRGAPAVTPLVVALAGHRPPPVRPAGRRGWTPRRSATPTCGSWSSTGSTRAAARRRGAGLPHPRPPGRPARGGRAWSICHGGPGTIMDAREAGHVPAVRPAGPAPRRARRRAPAAVRRAWSARSGVVRARRPRSRRSTHELDQRPRAGPCCGPAVGDRGPGHGSGPARGRARRADPVRPHRLRRRRTAPPAGPDRCTVRPSYRAWGMFLSRGAGGSARWGSGDLCTMSSRHRRLPGRLRPLRIHAGRADARGRARAG